jgi:hypothetical protein
MDNWIFCFQCRIPYTHFARIGDYRNTLKDYQGEKCPLGVKMAIKKSDNVEYQYYRI